MESTSYLSSVFSQPLPDGVFIRPIQPGDNPAVAAIIRQVMTEFSCVGEGYSILDPEVDKMYEAYHNERSVFYVVVKDGEPVGCGGIAPLAGGDPEVCELRKMYYLPALRGQGLGTRLLRGCMNEARRLGFKYMYLETVDRMSAANHLYQKAGFIRLEKPMGATGHDSCDRFYGMAL